MKTNEPIKEVPKSIYLIALQESLKLQAHYARLLNDYDGGNRTVFKSVGEWLKRLKETNSFEGASKIEDIRDL